VAKLLTKAGPHCTVLKQSGSVQSAIPSPSLSRPSAHEGASKSWRVGLGVGKWLGVSLGVEVGVTVGERVGEVVGLEVGETVGDEVGLFVG
jgi:hypothetical protein